MKTNKEIYKENGLLIQDEDFTCGPCSAYNLLHAMDPEMDISRELVKELALKKDNPRAGSSNKNLLALFQELGFEVIEHADSDLDTVRAYIEKGYYILSNYINALHNVGHYTVIESVDEKAVYLRDSSIGLARIMREHYERLWHDKDGVASRWFLAVKKR